MSPDATVPVSVVVAVQVHMITVKVHMVAVQVHMVAVHMGDNIVLYVHKSVYGPCSSPAQAPPT